MPERAASPSALALMRRWVVDYFNSHDAAAARDFIAPDYSLHIGDVVFAGRDTEWLPAVDQQMQLYPGLGMTVHRTLCGAGWAAAYFSEHGISKGRAAVWSGVAIYRSEAGVLTGCVAQEDYMTRHRQMKSGSADAVEPPALAPWDTECDAPNPEAEAVVRDWMRTCWPPKNAAIRVDDEHITGTPLRFDAASVAVETLLSSGDWVVFHSVATGTYEGGFDKVARTGQPAHLHCNGMLRVESGDIVEGRVIRDRFGLQAALLKEASQ